VTREVPRRAGSPGPTVLVALLIVVGIATGTFLALTRTPNPAPTVRPTSSDTSLTSLSPAATGTPDASSETSASVPAGSGPTSILVDRSLLDILPASIKGAPLVGNADGEAHDLTDPALAGEASALAAALVIDTTTGDFAYVSVVRLRIGVYSDAYFESWRETFDEGACSQAGGVAQSSAEADIAGHHTFIGHCVGGILTYHVHLTQPGVGDIIVSISALGDLRFGQLVVEGLR
jgi:hypothetical protein